MSTYKEQQNQKYTDRTLQMLCDLPDFCSVFYDKKQQKLSPKTLCDYSRHMKHYLEYLQQYDPRFSDRELIDFAVEDLSQISVSDATDFIKWITRSVMDDRASSNGNKISLSSAKTWKACISAYFMFFTFSGQLNGNPFACVDLAKIATYDDVREKGKEGKIANKKVMTVAAADADGNGGLINRSFIHSDKESNDRGNDWVAGEQPELSEKESIQFRQQFMLKHGIRDTLICSILQDTEIRISELVELNEKDMDLDNQRFYVYRAKNKSSWISISDDVCGLLQVYAEQRINWIRSVMRESGYYNHDRMLYNNAGSSGIDAVDKKDLNPSQPSGEGSNNVSGENDTGRATARLDLLGSQLSTKQITDAGVSSQGDRDFQENKYHQRNKYPENIENADLDALFIVMAGRCRGQRLSVRTVQRAMKMWKREMREYLEQKRM